MLCVQVILGTPILKALFGPSYTNLGVVAGAAHSFVSICSRCALGLHRLGLGPLSSSRYYCLSTQQGAGRGAELSPHPPSLPLPAGISSWIFQLPVMLLLFEVHSWRQANLHGKLPETDPAAGGGGANSIQLHSSSVDSELVKEQAAHAASLDSPGDYTTQVQVQCRAWLGVRSPRVIKVTCLQGSERN